MLPLLMARNNSKNFRFDFIKYNVRIIFLFIYKFTKNHNT